MFSVGDRITVRTWVGICNIGLPPQRIYMATSGGFEYMRPIVGLSGRISVIDKHGVFGVAIDGLTHHMWVPPEWCYHEDGDPVPLAPSDREFNGHCNPAEHPEFSGWCGRLRFHGLDCPTKRPSNG